jgi:hypothetical protein
VNALIVAASFVAPVPAPVVDILELHQILTSRPGDKELRKGAWVVRFTVESVADSTTNTQTHIPVRPRESSDRLHLSASVPVEIGYEAKPGQVVKVRCRVVADGPRFLLVRGAR